MSNHCLEFTFIFFSIFYYFGWFKNEVPHLLDLKPDPVAQLAMSEADPDFAKKYPNATHWIDGHGKWHFMTIEFDSLSGRRLVNVFPRQEGNKWPDEWWFGGVPK